MASPRAKVNRISAVTEPWTSRDWFVLLALPLVGVVTGMLTGPADPFSMYMGMTVGLVVGAFFAGGFLLMYWLTKT